MPKYGMNLLLGRWIFTLVRVEEEFLVPYTAAALEEIERCGGYGDSFIPFLDRFMNSLESEGWRAGSYFPGGWFRSLLASGLNPDRAEISPDLLAPFYLEEVTIDDDGIWRVGGKIITGRVLSHFLKNIHFDPQLERYLIRYWLVKNYEMRYIHHQSPPFRIHRVNFDQDEIFLELNDGSREKLRPDSLRLDGKERLYCAVKNEGLPAWFEDNARWNLLNRIEECNGGWALRHKGKESRLKLDGSLKFPGEISPD